MDAFGLDPAAAKVVDAQSAEGQVQEPELNLMVLYRPAQVVREGEGLAGVDVPPAAGPALHICPRGRRGQDFGTRDNVALLIEMGYEVYTKPYSDWLTPRLKRRSIGRRAWTRVGRNAEMIAWKACCLPDFPYPLDLTLERFQTGERQKQATLIHFGSDLVTTDLPGWFHRYNARQTIEAGIKEDKGVFEMVTLQQPYLDWPVTLTAKDVPNQ